RSNLEKLLTKKELLKSILVFEEGNGRKRLEDVIALPNPPEVSQVLPKLKAVISWDGGYVSPYAKKLMNILPSQVSHLPMYSMSTESIETLPHLINKKYYFLPTMSGTYPEFLLDNHLYEAHELKVNETYSL